MMVGMVDDRAVRFQQMRQQASPASASRPVSRPAARQSAPPRLSAINRRLAPERSSAPSMSVRDPQERPNPVTSFLGGLFEPRVPTPKWIGTGRKGSLGTEELAPIDSRVDSMFYRPLPPPPLTLRDEMATNPAGFGMPAIRNGRETMLYPNIERDDWGRLVAAPGYSETRDPRLPTYSGRAPVFVPYKPTQDELNDALERSRRRYGGSTLLD